MEETKYLVGYHGTPKKNVNTILNDGFEVSQNEYDWLGDGIYFFQDGLFRAKEWANERYKDNGVVLGAKIRCDNCLDLLDIKWTNLLGEIYDKFLGNLKKLNLPLPKQTSGAHRLDRQVINYACNVLEKSGNIINLVRGAFIEGNPIYPNSAIFKKTHIQIAVRKKSIIEEIWEIK